MDLFFPHRAQMSLELDVHSSLSPDCPLSLESAFLNTTVFSFLPGFSLQH